MVKRKRRAVHYNGEIFVRRLKELGTIDPNLVNGGVYNAAKAFAGFLEAKKRDEEVHHPSWEYSAHDIVAEWVEFVETLNGRTYFDRTIPNETDRSIKSAKKILLSLDPRDLNLCLLEMSGAVVNHSFQKSVRFFLNRHVYRKMIETDHPPVSAQI